MAGNLLRSRPADRVVIAVLQELDRQRAAGLLTKVGLVDLHGRVHVEGAFDLAALAHATEFALRHAFPALAEAE